MMVSTSPTSGTSCRARARVRVIFCCVIMYTYGGGGGGGWEGMEGGMGEFGTTNAVGRIAIAGGGPWGGNEGNACV